MATSRLDIADSTIALTSGRAKLWAILVGVNVYQDDQIPELQYSAADCRDLATVLVAATRQFPKKQIMVHHDSGTQLPTWQTVTASFAQVVKQAKPQDTVLFYFSGHGLIDPESRRAVLCLSDTQTDQLLDTGLQMYKLLQWLDECESRQQLIWLDACHSGELMIPGAKNVVLNRADETTTALVRLLRQQAVQNRGLYALLSCDQGQRSWEFPELGHGLFTYYLIQGLQGDAADATGVISADGLYQYLYKQITRFIEQKNQAIRHLNQQQRQMGEVLMHPEYPLQTPKRIVDGVGNVVVGLRSITPTKLNPSSAQPDQGQPSSQLSSQQSDRSRIAANRFIHWHYLLWGWAAALGVGGLYLGVALLFSTLVGSPNNPATNSSADVSNTTPNNVPGDVSTAAPATCNLRLELVEPIPKQVMEPQVILNNCSSEHWQPTKVQPLLEGNPVWAVAFGKDDSLLVSGGGNVGEIWDLATYKQTYVLAGHTDTVYGVAVSPDAKQVVTASADQTARIWNVATGTLERVLRGHAAAIWSVKFSADGKTIATASEDSTVKLWDVATGTSRYTFAGHQDSVYTVAFHPKNDIIASAGQDRTIRLWNRDGTQVRNLTGHADTVRAIAFSQDGTKLASASWDRTVKIWDSQTGKLLHTLSGHNDRVVTVAFSPDGKTLASGSRTTAFDPKNKTLPNGSVDQTIKLWNVEDGTLIGTLYGQAGWVMSLAFSADGKTLASGSNDQTILLWQK